MRRLVQYSFPVIFGLAAVSGWASDPVPDFRLENVNPNSPRFQAQVSPRDYILQVSGYYFGHAS
jgi:hypothetical protein